MTEPAECPDCGRLMFPNEHLDERGKRMLECVKCEKEWFDER